jgi:hypothetical protein
LSKNDSTVRGALRGVAIAITIVSVITFATIGYSGYQVFSTVTTPSSASLGRAVLTWVNGTLAISAGGSFPNNGLYPIEVSTLLNATSTVGDLGNASSPMVTIPPSTSRTFNLSVSLNPYALGGKAADEIFYNGSEATLSFGLKASLVPFADLKTTQNTSLYIEPFVGNVTVASASDGPSGFALGLTFTDHETVPVVYAMQVSMSGAGNSSVVQGILQPGEQGSAQLVFSGVVLPPGSYVGTLHTTVFGSDLALPLRMTVS